ncbi:MAG TPA: Rossmann fold nucleotide-binding protein [Marmoricola sp.]|nr:Rossmann fold nucleotide-binding protein [Marmoricola sp.]
MQPTEIETLEEFDRYVAHGLRSMRGFHLQSVDLSDRARTLAGLSVAGAVFLGCRFAPGSGPGSELDVRRRGGLIFPAVPDVPFDPYRGELYTPAELYAGLDHGYAATLDAAAYAWSRSVRTIDKSLAMALHDHAIDDAVEEYAEGRRIVGVMGGHTVRRDTPTYLGAARLGQALAAGEGLTVLSGGGPGLMEATNLGAWFAGAPGSDLVDAIGLLAAVPDYDPDVTAWARVAFEVLARWPDGTGSLGIPTWFYGHEPPNVFASRTAKYFRNALREDMLLRLCRAGVVFLPGTAGTVQEIFQAACANYYAEPDLVAPMVLVGREYWTSRLPAWPLLEVLGDGRAMGPRLHLVDDPAEVLPLLLEVGGRRG